MNDRHIGRPRLNISLSEIVEAVRSHRKIVAAARELGCSPAYVHMRLKRYGLNLSAVLKAEDISGLIEEADEQHPDQDADREQQSQAC